MATRIVMPSFGMYTAEGTFGRWLVEPGAEVEAGAVIAEIVTEKASYEIEAPADGRLHPLARTGDALTVEGLIGWVLAEGEEAPAAERERVAEAEGASASGRGARDDHGRGQAPPLHPEADSRSSVGGGDLRLDVGARLAPARSSTSATTSGARVKASPAARKLAAAHGIDVATLTGTGPGGRIVEADVLAAASFAARAGGGARELGVVPASVPWRVAQRIPLTGVRGAVAARLRRTIDTAVSLTLAREVRCDALLAARAGARAGGLDLPWDAVFVKLLADALRARPELNAVIAGDEILVLDEVHVGFAVPLDPSRGGGLVVPVVRDADARPLAAVAAAVRTLGERARAGALAPPDVLGGTATVSNLGAHGVDAFTPVLNPPQSVVLGVGRIARRPVVGDDDRIGVASTCVLSLTFDHRVADGAPAALLLDAIARAMGDADALARLVAEPARA